MSDREALNLGGCLYFPGGCKLFQYMRLGGWPSLDAMGCCRVKSMVKCCFGILANTLGLHQLVTISTDRRVVIGGICFQGKNYAQIRSQGSSDKRGRGRCVVLNP